MHAHYLLRSSTLRRAFLLSLFVSICVLLFSSGGLYFLRKRRIEIANHRCELEKLYCSNLKLAKEVHRFMVKDPELYEALARQRGLSREGETIYTFYNNDSN